MPNNVTGSARGSGFHVLWSVWHRPSYRHHLSEVLASELAAMLPSTISTASDDAILAGKIQREIGSIDHFILFISVVFHQNP